MRCVDDLQAARRRAGSERTGIVAIGVEGLVVINKR